MRAHARYARSAGERCIIHRTRAAVAERARQGRWTAVVGPVPCGGGSGSFVIEEGYAGYYRGGSRALRRNKSGEFTWAFTWDSFVTVRGIFCIFRETSFNNEFY